MVFFKNRLDLTIATDDDLPLIVEAIEIRNISVHNNCRINRRFVQRLKLDPSIIGKMKTLSLARVEKTAVLLGDLVKEIDSMAAERYAIESHKVEITFWDV